MSIVPVAVMRAEDSMPIIAHLPLTQRLTGLISEDGNHFSLERSPAEEVRARIQRELDDPLRSPELDLVRLGWTAG